MSQSKEVRITRSEYQRVVMENRKLKATIKYMKKDAKKLVWQLNLKSKKRKNQ